MIGAPEIVPLTTMSGPSFEDGAGDTPSMESTVSMLGTAPGSGPTAFTCDPIRMLPDTLRIRCAWRFAARAHASIDQRRKYTRLPYIVHPCAVAAIVSCVPHTETQICAALLHDTVEDTPVTIDMIAAEFDAEIAEMVGWLTDVSKRSDGNRSVRKAIDRDHSAAAPAAVQTVKVADVLENAGGIVRHDPDFAKIWMAEKRDLLARLTKADSSLLNFANLIVDNYFFEKQPNFYSNIFGEFIYDKNSETEISDHINYGF